MPTIARLRPGATLQQADTEIRFLQPQIATMFPWPMPKTWNPDLAAVSLQTGMIGDVRERLLILLVAVVLVLLIACANVANLTLSRASVREKEIAIRASMGAARHRIIRQLITESVLMASFGGALGLLLADRRPHAAEIHAACRHARPRSRSRSTGASSSSPPCSSFSPASHPASRPRSTRRAPNSPNRSKPAAAAQRSPPDAAFAPS